MTDLRQRSTRAKMRTRRQVLATLALASAIPCFGQPAQRIHRIGFLFAGTLAQRPQAQGFWERLKELGYTPGQNILIDVREAEGNLDRLPQLAEDLVKSKPEVIVAVTPVSVHAAQKATTTMPIVMAIIGNALTFVKNLARPEGNVTGPATTFETLSNKRLELLKDLLPKVTRVGALWNARNQGQIFLEPVEAVARNLGVELRSIPFRGPDDLENALTASLRLKYEALLILSDPVTFDRRASIIAFAAANRLPSFHQFADEAFDGGLAAYGINLREEYRRTAPYVVRLLKGAKPADLPVEHASNSQLIINMKTARTLGIAVPPAVLLRADKVVE